MPFFASILSDLINTIRQDGFNSVTYVGLSNLPLVILSKCHLTSCLEAPAMGALPFLKPLKKPLYKHLF